MPNKAQNKRRQEEEAAERRRRRAQSQRDKAKHHRELDERITSITHVFQRNLALNRVSIPPTIEPPSIAGPTKDSSSDLQGPLMETRSDQFMRNIAQ
jgi:hypothetical protein